MTLLGIVHVMARLINRKRLEFWVLWLRPTLEECLRSSFLRTNLDWFEANWILVLDCMLVLSLIIGSPNQELSLQHCLSVWTNWFSLENRCHVGLASICHFLVLDSRLKALGTNLKLSTNKIAWIHSSLDHGPSSKVALRFQGMHNIWGNCK